MFIKMQSFINIIMSYIIKTVLITFSSQLKPFSSHFPANQNRSHHIFQSIKTVLITFSSQLCLLLKTIYAWRNPRNNNILFSVLTIFSSWIITFAVFSGVSSEYKLLMPHWITDLSSFFVMLAWIWCFKFVAAPRKVFISIRSYFQCLYFTLLHLHVLIFNRK